MAGHNLQIEQPELFESLVENGLHERNNKIYKTNEYFQGGSMNTYIYMVRHGESPKLDGVKEHVV